MNQQGTNVQYVAIMPHYTEEGKHVAKLIDLAGNVHYSNRSFRSTFKRFLSAHGTSKELNQLRLGRLIRKSRLVPIIMDAEHAMIPFSTTVCAHTGEIANGYVFCHVIASLDEYEITLHNGVKLATHNRLETLSDRHLNARAVLQLLRTETPKLGRFQLI